MTPEAIEKVEFPPALRGYDKQQVRTFLQMLGNEFRTLQAKLSEAEAKLSRLTIEADSVETLTIDSETEPFDSSTTSPSNN